VTRLASYRPGLQAGVGFAFATVLVLVLAGSMAFWNLHLRTGLAARDAVAQAHAETLRHLANGELLPATFAEGITGMVVMDGDRLAVSLGCYFDFVDMINTNDVGYFPYTPPVLLLHGLRASLDLLFAEGLPAVFERHHRLAEGVRRGVAALGLELCAAGPEWHSDTVSAIYVPEGVDGAEVCRIGYQRYRTSFGAGLSKVAGKLFRIGHLGDLNEVSCLAALSSAEMALADAGADIELGAGVAAAQAYYRGALAESTDVPPRSELAAVAAR
jgi:alanine-glyoxylate transaminase/serine-glyoxylate transaminase/serine-pyruvate transaminase